jgi:glycosyltransferase involved in cell wall biosynthesis
LENHNSKQAPEVSVVVPISEFHDDMKRFYDLYANELDGLGKSFEFIFVIDGNFSKAQNDLKELIAEEKPIKIVKFTHNQGEAMALMEGFRQASGSKILTLASRIQIEPADMAKLFSAYEEGNELVITRRYPRKDPLANRIQSKIYHFLVKVLTGCQFNDITSGMRLIDKKIVPDLILYGDLHRFLPIFALQQGVKVKEINVSQRDEDSYVRVRNPGVYLRRILDILTLFFLVKFTKKPLRFFGLISSVLFLLGGAITTYLGILRIMGKIDLANRPLLLLGILLIVFSAQIFSVGLLGELIIFTRAKEIRYYRIDEIIE